VRSKNPMIKIGISSGLRKIGADAIITALPVKADTAFPKSLANNVNSAPFVREAINNKEELLWILCIPIFWHQ
jgi:hypothetical protein